MKKFNILKYTVVAALLVAFTACDSILEDVEPATSVSGEVVLTSPDGVNALRASMYAKIHESFSFTTDYFVGPSAFADETRNRPGSSRFQGYTQATGTSGTTHLGNWGAAYDIIQDANLLIGAIDCSECDAATLAQFRGEAHALRAFAYHTMVRVYGYEPGNYSVGPENNWDAGVILRTDPVLDVADADLRPRSSVDDVYAQIFADLDAAETAFGEAGGDAGTNTYASQAFVDGVRARAHLYAGNWANAASAAQDAIANSGGLVSSDSASVADMFYEDAGDHPEALLKIVLNPNTEGGGYNNNGPATYTSDGFIAQLPTQFLIDKYGAGDWRLGWYQDCTTTQNNPLTQPTDCDGVNTNGLAIVKFTGDLGNSVDNLPYMRVSEMYLIWAEAAARDANNPAAGLAPLQTLRDARNAGAVPAAALADMAAFEDEILDERMRELAVEGHRFYDLKRLARDIRHPDGTIKMRADSYRILAPLGSGLRNVNAELVENPGYQAD